jgi:hypothetical protein
MAIIFHIHLYETVMSSFLLLLLSQSLSFLYWIVVVIVPQGHLYGRCKIIAALTTLFDQAPDSTPPE